MFFSLMYLKKLLFCLVSFKVLTLNISFWKSFAKILTFRRCKCYGFHAFVTYGITSWLKRVYRIITKFAEYQ